MPFKAFSSAIIVIITGDSSSALLWAHPGWSSQCVITLGNKSIWAIFLLLTALELAEIPVRGVTGRMDVERVISFFKQILERVFGVKD